MKKFFQPFQKQATLCLIIFLCMAQKTNAQNNKALIDSLEKITLTQHDSDLVKTYNDLTWEYRTVLQSKAIEYGNKALELATKINFNKGIAQAYNDLGILYYDKQDYTEALKYYSKSMEIRSKSGDKKGVAALYNKMGIIYQARGEYLKALENQQKALNLFEEIKYDIGISYSLNNIAVLNYNIGNIEEALKYNFKSIEIKKKIGDSYGLSGSYVNIANIYLRKKDYNDAISYYQQALEICRQTGDKEYLSSTLNNLSSAYLGMNDFSNALKAVEESYQLRKELDDKKDMISCLVNMSGIYLKQNKNEIAFEKLNEALKLSTKTNVLPELPSLYGMLTTYYEKKGDLQKALEYQKLQYVYRDSLVNEDLNSKITEMNTKYETEKKQKEIEKNKLELSVKELDLNRQKTQRNLLLISIIVLGIFSYLFYSRYKFKQKVLFNNEMMHQQELRSKAIIEAEEKERIRIARELHDGIGQQLSAVKLNLSSLEASIELKNNEQKLMMKNALELIDDSVKEVRAVSHNMMPNALLKSGLVIAVREFLNRINATKLKIELEVHDLNERLDNTTETILFRVLQEIVNNIIKHSQATAVQIQLIKHDNELTMMVEDNGIGFEIDQIKNEGIGLKNIQSRIQYLHGSVDFDSRIGKGTTVTIEVPLN